MKINKETFLARGIDNKIFNSNMEATVVMAKCKVNKEPFGIRAQKQGNYWVFNWAFKMSNKAAQKEGYDQTKIAGAISLSYLYPGCPHCGAKSFFQCGRCEKIVCMVGNEKNATCPHCGLETAGFIETENFDNVSGGAF